MHDIQNKQDIKLFVDAFYAAAKKDPLLGPIFNEAIKEEEWSIHVERIYSFWNTVLFKEPDYLGNPFRHHANLPIYEMHFSKWLALLKEVIDHNFAGEKADEVVFRAHKMSEMFQLKLAAMRSKPNSRPIL